MAADAESTIRIGIDTTEALASIKNLQRQISAFHTQLQSSGNAANAAVSQNLQRGLINNLNATGKFAASLTTVKSSAESFTMALERNKLSMGEYFRFAGASSKTFGRLFRSEFDLVEKVARERVKTINTQFIKMGRDANGAITAIKVRPLVADLDSLAGRQAIAAQKQQVLNQLLTQGSTNLLNFGKNTQWAGRQLMVGFTLPLAYLGTVAGKTFMKMEEQALRFKRVYGELFTTSDETDRMVKDIQRLATEYTKYGVAVEKTMELAADAAAMGKMGADLLAQVAEATRLAVLGNVENEQALATTISLTNAFGTATNDLAKKINFLNAVENQTVTSIEDLTVAIPKAGPVIKQLGGDVEDLAFFLTAMKEGGINASESANALKSGLASLINPTEKASEFMQGFGINLKGIVESNAGDVKGIVIDFAKALDTLDPLSRARSIEQLFGKFQFSRLSTLFQNVIQEGNQASRVLKLTRNTTEELAILSERELKRVEESTGYKFKKALEDLKASLIPLGEQFLKIITPIAEFASKALGEFNKLSDGTKTVITTIVTLLGGVGPIALMSFGLLANGIANIIKLFASVRNVFARFGGAVTGAGTSVSYMTQEQLEAAAVAASLNQTHSQLIQTFTLEKASIDSLTTAYNKAVAAQARFNTGAVARGPVASRGAKVKGYNSGVLSVPGPKGAGDIIPAMLAPGEAVIPADAATKYRGFIADMIAGKIPGFFKGFLGMPRSGKSTQKNREAATEIYGNFKQSRLRDQEPENYGHQISPTTGHSFPIFGLGGVYAKPDGSRVFVKPVLDEKAAIAEVRATEIARRVHGLEAPEQRIVVMRDPTDITRQRKFIALESRLNPNLVNDNPVGQFTKEQYFKQLVASLVRTDKDLSASNLFGNVLADVGPAGVFSRASGLRDFTPDLPSMEQQAMINLLGVKGGAKKAFAESTVGLMANLTPKQYHDSMIAEIKKVLPKLRKTVDSFEFSTPEEALAYTNMVKRLEDGLGVDWTKFHAIHSAVKPAVPKQTSAVIPGYRDGVLSVPGPKGAGDVMPAMLAPGEAVIPAKTAEKYRGFISAMIAGKIPGFVKGTENFGAAAKNYIKMQSEKYANIPEMEGLLQKTVDRINAEGIKVTTKTGFDAEIQKDHGRIFALANTTARVSPTTGDSSAMTGLNATHGNAPITVTPDMARTLAAQVGEDSGFGKRLMESAATGRSGTALSNLTFGMPAAFNRQEALMSGADSAAFVKKFPKLFMEPIVAMYGKTISGLSADKLGVNQFAEIVSKKLGAAGKKAVDEKMFYKLIEESIEEMKRLNPNSPALKALERAKNEFRIVQFGGGGGRRGEITKGLAYDSRGDIVKSSGAPNYRGDASRAAIAGGTAAADANAEKLLARALKAGTYLPDVEGTASAPASKATTAAAKKTATKGAKVEKSAAPSKSRQIKPKKFPGGFDINRVSSVIDKRGTFRYFYLNEDGKKVRLATLDYTNALGLDPKRLKELEQMALTEVEQEATAPKAAPKGTNKFAGRALGIGALALGGAGVAASVMPQGQEQGGGIDLMTGAIIASTVASIPSMFGKTIPEVFRSIASFTKPIPGWAKVVGLAATAIAGGSAAFAKFMTPVADTEEYVKAFNASLVGGTNGLQGVAETFGRVSSSDIFARRRQDEFTPLSFAPGQIPIGDSFVASEEGKKFVQEYQKALSASGPKQAVSRLAQELSQSVISGVFSAKEARSIAMSVAKELGDLQIGINVSAKISQLLGPNGEKLEQNLAETLVNSVAQASSSINALRNANKSFLGSDRDERGFKGAGELSLSPADTGLLVGSAISLFSASRDALATFELIYDEKAAIVQKELEHARAIGDSKKEAQAIAQLSKIETERTEKRAKLQKEIAKQMNALESLFSASTTAGREAIIGGFGKQIEEMYKDTPLADISKEVTEQLKNMPAYSVVFSAALASGDLSIESFASLLKSLEDVSPKLEVDILANLSAVIKSQGAQSGSELLGLLNKVNDPNLKLRLTAFVKQDASYLDFFATLGTIPGGEEKIEFFLDVKNRVELAKVIDNLKEVDNLIKTGDFNMENLLKLDLDVNEAAFETLKENAEYFDKLPNKQKKIFTSVFLSVLPTIDNKQIDAEVQRQSQEIAATGAFTADSMSRRNNSLNTPAERAKIAAKLAADYAKSLIDYLDLTDTTGTPKPPATTGNAKPQVTFLDSIVRKIRDMAKSTQKLTQGWKASSRAVADFYKELVKGKADDQLGLSQRLRSAGVDESLIPGLLDLKAANPKEFAELFNGRKVSGGLSELGRAINETTILTNAVDSFGEAQSKAARQSRQQTTAISRLMQAGVSYSDALEMVQDESLMALAASGQFNDKLRDQIALFRDAKVAAAESAQGLQDEFRTAFDLAMERFSAEEAKIDIKLQLDTKSDKALIEDLQEKIALINDKNDDLDYGLTLIAEQEESINKEYDDRIEALDQVERANSRIASLQQKQVSLAQAISEGDVFAAAKAMQELEAANAEAFAVDRRDILDREKVAKLEQATAEVIVDGKKKKLTRLEIEELIKKNLKEIAKIEEEQLEPAELRVRKLTAAAEAAKSGLKVAESTKLEWEKVGNEIDLARLDVVAYDGMLKTALGKVNEIVEAWKRVGKEQAAATGQGGKPGAGSSTVGTPADNMDKEGAILTIKTLREQNLVAAQTELAALGDIEKQISDADRYARNMANAGKTTEAASAIKTRDSLQKTLDGANAKINGILNAISDLMLRFGLASSEFTARRDPDSRAAFANGGFVSGKGTATSDSIPALLSNGEYVINARTAKQIGVDMLDAINFGKVPGFAKGGQAGKPEPKKTNFFENLANMAKSIFMPTVAGSAMANRQDASALNKFNLYEENKPFLISNATNQAKKPTVAELLAAAKKEDNKVVNKVLATKAAPKPTSGGTSAVVKATNKEVPFLPSKQMFERGRAGEQQLQDLPALFVPLLGNVLSLNALEGSLERKDYGMAALDAIGVVPGFGNVVKGFGKAAGVVAPKAVKAASKITTSIDNAIAKAIISSSLKNPKVSIGMTASGIEGMVKDRKLKNMFELDPSVTGFRPGDYRADRLRIEEEFLGIPANTSAAARPTYGTIASKFTLPYDMVSNLSRTDSKFRTTGRALSLLDPRFNKTFSNYVYSRQSTIRASAEAGMLGLKPGAAQGTFSLSDSFNKFGKPYRMGNKVDRAQATKDIMAELTKKDSVLVGGPFKLPYLEAQISSKTNPFDIASKIFTPYSKNKPSLLDKLSGAVPGSGQTKRQSMEVASKIDELLSANKVSGIKSGTIRNAPSSLMSIPRTSEKLTNLQRGRFNAFRSRLDNKAAESSDIYKLLTRDIPRARQDKIRQEYLKNLPPRDNVLAMGGLVKPEYFNYGGMVKAYSKGGDVVPSMLTPGEFVMSKYAVQNYGVDKMKALNSGTYNGDSVYNYNLSVNVKSDANPDDIARTVMTQIRQVESQRIRSAR